jgi:hypothetical protein
MESIRKAPGEWTPYFEYYYFLVLIPEASLTHAGHALIYLNHRLLVP